MRYDFIRQIATAPDEHTAAAVFEKLNEAGFEVFLENGEGIFPNMHPGESPAGGRMYVAAADRESAKELLKGAGYTSLLTPDEKCVPKSVLTEEERIMAAARRKRKWLYIECGIVILIGLILMLAR